MNLFHFDTEGWKDLPQIIIGFIWLTYPTDSIDKCDYS